MVSISPESSSGVRVTSEAVCPEVVTVRMVDEDVMRIALSFTRKEAVASKVRLRNAVCSSTAI